jgi:hypothetical protein
VVVLAVLGFVCLYAAYLLARRARRDRIPNIIEQVRQTVVSARQQSVRTSPHPRVELRAEVSTTPATRSGVSTKIVSEATKTDQSILDVAGAASRIPLADGLTTAPMPVPPWAHQYVFSTRELDGAGQRQKEFYYAFREAFVMGVNYDLEGNTNYAFILLFDLVRTSGSTADHATVERQLKRLGEAYPRTKRYLWTSLATHLTKNGFSEEAMRVLATYEVERHPAYGYHYENNYWQYGSRHKKRLGLSPEDVKLLNRLSNPRNNFLEIQFCEDQVIWLFLAVVKDLDKGFRAEGSTLDKELATLADLVAQREYRYRLGSQNYNYALSWIGDIILGIIFKHCENAVRENLNHKRKLSSDWQTHEDAEAVFSDRILSRLPGAILTAVKKIEFPDRETETELNRRNATRWKIELERLKARRDWSGDQFIEAVRELGDLNAGNPQIEMIFFEASKFAAGFDRQAALTLYVHYLYHDLLSVKFDNRKLTKTVQKSLFTTKEQLHQFEAIVSALIATADLDSALKEVAGFYVPKRRHIALSTTEIIRAKVKDADTVELLNEYLQDEFEDEQNVIIASQMNDQEVLLEISVKPAVGIQASDELLELRADEASNESRTSPMSKLLSPLQEDLLRLFEKGGLLLHQDDVESFARSNGVFSNQLIESINDACYDVIDDVLIEEEDDNYTILESYYRIVIPDDK